MKILKVFAVFVVLHLGGWTAAHVYLSNHQEQVLVVVDTSYAMKPKFSEMEDWISAAAANARYKTIVIGTDKALLGELDSLKSNAVIFRTAFGRMTDDSLARYASSKAQEKILLSDGSIQPEGWKLVKF